MGDRNKLKDSKDLVRIFPSQIETLTMPWGRYHLDYEMPSPTSQIGRLQKYGSNAVVDILESGIHERPNFSKELIQKHFSSSIPETRRLLPNFSYHRVRMPLPDDSADDPSRIDMAPSGNFITDTNPDVAKELTYKLAKLRALKHLGKPFPGNVGMDPMIYDLKFSPLEEMYNRLHNYSYLRAKPRTEDPKDYFAFDWPDMISEAPLRATFYHDNKDKMPDNIKTTLPNPGLVQFNPDHSVDQEETNRLNKAWQKVREMHVKSAPWTDPIFGQTYAAPSPAVRDVWDKKRDKYVDEFGEDMRPTPTWSKEDILKIIKGEK